jgi:glycosyltransferase involved in cell wall biosynthesis
MIFFDTTKSGSAGHRSGLLRVSGRLAEELNSAATAVRWATWDRRVATPDWFVTAELFSEAERPGVTAFLQGRACRTAAIFHDAIPLKHPHITWPQSVARHPGYMKLLASFNRVWAVSAASRDELLGFWRWQGLVDVPPVEVLALGADFNRATRVVAHPRSAGTPPRLLCVGILEPRKNQAFLLDVCETLWRDGLDFELHLVGRVNPHFGAPIAARAKALARARPLRWHQHADDAALAALYAGARATVFPTIAEGCGLPLLESLWMGVPCVCSDLPVLRENAEGGGCIAVPLNDTVRWAQTLRQVLTDGDKVGRLTAEATSRSLPTWSDAAKQLRAELA